MHTHVCVQTNTTNFPHSPSSDSGYKCVIQDISDGLCHILYTLGFLCCPSASMEQATNRPEAAAINRLISVQTETLCCALGPLVKGSMLLLLLSRGRLRDNFWQSIEGCQFCRGSKFCHFPLTSWSLTQG